METLSAGRVHSLTQNTVYALPPSLNYLQSTSAVETSVDNSTFAVLTGSTTGAVTAAAFVRCTGSTNAVMSVKRYSNG